MAKRKCFGVSPITNTIYYGMQDTDKNMWVGNNKVDVTDDAIAAVFEWFLGNMECKDVEREEYIITYPNKDFELVMGKKK